MKNGKDRNSRGFCTGRRLVWACGIGLVLASHALPAVGAGYVVEGKIRYEIRTPSGGMSVEQDDDFTVKVSDCNWHIKKIPTRYVSQGKPEPLGDSGVLCSDGTNFYEVLTYNKGQSAYGRIGPGSTPFCLTDPKMLVLWFAYASGCHFGGAQDKFLVNPFLMLSQTNYARDFRVRAEWRLHEESPFLPAHIAFDAKPRYELGAEEESGANWQYTNAVYSAGEFVKEDGLAFPKKISVDYFTVNPTDGAIIMKLANITIQATAFRKDAVAETFRPGDVKFVTVSDMRTICSNTPFGVASFEKAGWPDLEASKAEAERLLVKYKAVKVPPPPRSPRLILAILLLSPLVLAAIWKLFQQKQNIGTGNV